MQKLIKNGVVSNDNWTVLKVASGPEVLQAAPGKAMIIPLQLWKDFREEVEEYTGSIAIWLDSNETVDRIGPDLHTLPLIALNFPAFSDGRSYTSARELRESLNYEGEIRAIGDVLRDQIYYMSRCGFDSFALRHDQDPEACLAAFKDFKTGYQSSVAEPLPLFRRR
ncbi:MAG: DUF934 domain-containing protein [Gammaproteobacteria bacterium]|jgi:uncharacterized protein (DUF934 family)|nr:DUF934 domain-containing protein [Gammaproteobacteria bacterium]MBT3860685.1 DUF934 domain-containing protein [Gammaproteobacteria bacterium]MBT3988333.1 DUF934 domain-containing protein [Gammaproteobacteria bacterium]MBT4256057.1 DUF934 domain-containing protein [Gammaproteobacteria bacterium]MBT4581975.1 DUF934 domain-containing protein [Gammaproteobacteria bacterium]